MITVKICGVRTCAHAIAATRAGANMLGFIFAPARRQIQPDEAAEIAAAVRAVTSGERHIDLVGVFVNETPEQMLKIADQCGLDLLQLSGDEPAAIVEHLPGRALLKAIRLNGAANEAGWLYATPPHTTLLVEAHITGAYGGAGVLADWNRAAELARRQPIFLAGGLSPDNLDAAIRQVRPYGVDVSSGVETDGVKDVAKITAFITTARTVEQELITGLR